MGSKGLRERFGERPRVGRVNDPGHSLSNTELGLPFSYPASDATPVFLGAGRDDPRLWRGAAGVLEVAEARE